MNARRLRKINEKRGGQRSTGKLQPRTKQEEPRSLKAARGSRSPRRHAVSAFHGPRCGWRIWCGEHPHRACQLTARRVCHCAHPHWLLAVTPSPLAPTPTTRSASKSAAASAFPWIPSLSTEAPESPNSGPWRALVRPGSKSRSTGGVRRSPCPGTPKPLPRTPFFHVRLAAACPNLAEISFYFSLF